MRPLLQFQAGRDHRDGDHEVAPRAELEKRGTRIRGGGGDDDCGHQLVGPQAGAAVTGDEPFERRPLARNRGRPGQRRRRAGNSVVTYKREFTGAAATLQAHVRVQDEQGGHAVRRRRCVAEVAGQRAAVLDLPPADLPGGQAHAVEPRRQIGFDRLGPGDQGADLDPVRKAADARERVEGADVQDRQGVRVIDARLPPIRPRRHRPDIRRYRPRVFDTVARSGSQVRLPGSPGGDRRSPVHPPRMPPRRAGLRPAQESEIHMRADDESASRSRQVTYSSP